MKGKQCYILDGMTQMNIHMEKNSVNGYNKQKFPNENHQIWADFK
jgi:hypothetical protein